MTRTILAFTFSIAIGMLVWGYAVFIEQIRPPASQVVEREATGRYDIKVVCTFDCKGNDFGMAAVKVAFRDQVLLETADLIASGTPLVVEDVLQVKQGVNDFLIQCTPVETSGINSGGAFSLEPRDTRTDVEVARAVRVIILRDGYEIARQVIWSDQTGPISELVRIELFAETVGEN